MSLYCCEVCGCIENTACANYWSRTTGKLPLLCSECDPAIGKWHGRFEKRPAAGMHIDNEGHLWSDPTVAPKHLRFIGTIPEPKDEP